MKERERKEGREERKEKGDTKTKVKQNCKTIFQKVLNLIKTTTEMSYVLCKKKKNKSNKSKKMEPHCLRNTMLTDDIEKIKFFNMLSWFPTRKTREGEIGTAINNNNKECISR